MKTNITRRGLKRKFVRQADKIVNKAILLCHETHKIHLDEQLSSPSSRAVVDDLAYAQQNELHTLFNHELGKLVRKYFKSYRTRSRSGEYRTAYVVPHMGVLKVSNEADSSGLMREAKYIAHMRHFKKLARFFPETEIRSFVFKNPRLNRSYTIHVQYQEYIPCIGRRTSWADRDCIDQLSCLLGVDDAHSYNYGWARDRNGLYPVYVDLDFHTIPSWAQSKKGTKHAKWMVDLLTI